MLQRPQLLAMIKLQDELNKVVDPNWLTAGCAWPLAILQESSEAIDHHGWKWWKKQDQDMAQLRIELVDIWHFALSIYLERQGGDYEAAASAITAEQIASSAIIRFDRLTFRVEQLNLLQCLTTMAGLATCNRFEIGVFQRARDLAALDDGALFDAYVGKNVLNIFRQRNGYKDGTYVKMWHGREDNEWMAEHWLELSKTVPADQLPDALMQALETEYASVKADATGQSV